MHKTKKWRSGKELASMSTVGMKLTSELLVVQE